MGEYKQPGFTIVELLIVIVVIGILVAITIVAYSGVQQKATDSVRQSNIEATAKALELYYIDNGKYPGYGSEFSLRAWVEANLKLPESSLIAPGDNPAATATSFLNLTSAQLDTYATHNQYAYYNYSGTRASKTVCGASGCQMFELYWYSNSKGAWQTTFSLNAY